MRPVVDLLVVALLLASTARGADVAACSVRKGLYTEWLGVSNAPDRASARKESSSSAPARAGTDAAKRAAIVGEYEEFFRRLSKAGAEDAGEAFQSCCVNATADPLASLVCRGAGYLKGQRNGYKDFIDAFPAGRRGAQMIWALEAISADQAYRLIDELFVLVLDGRPMAASKYFNLLGAASKSGERHLDEQVKILLRESPAVVVKEWAVLQRYQPKLKELISELAATLPKVAMDKMRRDLVEFCPADNLDCPEILKLFSRPE